MPSQSDLDDRPTVYITVEGGVIQDIECPKGVRVVVWDYDVEGSEDEESIVVDQDGNECMESIWEGE